MTYRPKPPEFEPRTGPEPRRIGESLDGMARRLGAPAAKAVGAVFTQWEDAVGPLIAGHVRPVGLADGVLTVAVDDPAWAAQFKYLAKDIVGKIASTVGPGVVGRIEVRVERR